MDNQLLTELKQYCFALYIGQKVLFYRHWNDGKQGIKCYPHIDFLNDDWHLQLRPLSSIKDQEHKHIGYVHINIAVNQSWCYQYLQQQGFALPVYFKGVQYSVERLIELGIYQVQP